MDLIERLEAELQIRQLVARYAVAFDSRDHTTLAALHAPDVREAAMAGLAGELGSGPTFHLTADPVITFEGPRAASGVVQCRVERESGLEWIVAGVRYRDSYVCLDGTWFLAARWVETLYAADVLSRPS